MSQSNHQIQVASYLKSNYGQRLVVPVLLDLQLVIIQNLYEAFQCDDINFILIGLFFNSSFVVFRFYQFWEIMLDHRHLFHILF